jgi:hypothetical protein
MEPASETKRAVDEAEANSRGSVTLVIRSLTPRMTCGHDTGVMFDANDLHSSGLVSLVAPIRAADESRGRLRSRVTGRVSDDDHLPNTRQSPMPSL